MFNIDSSIFMSKLTEFGIHAVPDNRKMKDKGGFCYEKEMVNNHNGVHGLIVHCGNGLSVYNGEKTI